MAPQHMCTVDIKKWARIIPKLCYFGQEGFFRF